jgi:hypothetical protein
MLTVAMPQRNHAVDLMTETLLRNSAWVGARGVKGGGL